jgi:hypothetical protein
VIAAPLPDHHEVLLHTAPGRHQSRFVYNFVGSGHSIAMLPMSRI